MTVKLIIIQTMQLTTNFYYGALSSLTLLLCVFVAVALACNSYIQGQCCLGFRSGVCLVYLF